VRLATVALLAALAPPLVACGQQEPTDREKVAATVRTFGAATAAKDYQRLCRDILAAELVTRIQQAGLTCRDALRTGLHGVREPQVTVGRITVDGERATAEVRTTATGQPPSVDHLRLVRQGDGWRIASLATP
jgi:hypothetical protein